jgi:hypothetical protein
VPILRARVRAAGRRFQAPRRVQREDAGREGWVKTGYYEGPRHGPVKHYREYVEKRQFPRYQPPKREYVPPLPQSIFDLAATEWLLEHESSRGRGRFSPSVKANPIRPKGASGASRSNPETCGRHRS